MGGLLQSIRNPRDLKQIPPSKLPTLADEIRAAVTRRFAMRRDYLASALGMVDLTTALHYVFDFAHDRLVFDLAHQAAAHLVLTRPELAGAEGSSFIEGAFPGEEREPWDQFFSCHAGASISKALGLAAGADDENKTVAVIGDGAVVSGIALEALNSGDSSDKDVLIILNDNEMSISKVVGAMGEVLSKIRVGKAYNDLKRDAHKLLQAIPFFGESLDKAAEQLRDALTKALVPGALFEKIGPRYFGPVDGHNLPHLVQLLEETKRQRGFYLLHVVTQRQAPREEPSGEVLHVQDPTLSDDLEFALQGDERYNALVVQCVESQLEKDPRTTVVALATPEMESLGGMVSRLRTIHPNRLWNMRVNEQHGVAFAAGIAKAGKRPLVITPAALFARAHDQVTQEVGSRGLPVVFLLTYAGLVASDTTVDHGADDLSFLRGVTGMDVMAPRDGRELDAMVSLALRQDGPAAIRVPHGFAPDRETLLPEKEELHRGRSEVLRQGEDACVLALGSMLYPVMEAAGTVAEQGVELTVVNPRFVRPFNPDFLRTLLETYGLVFTVEEHRFSGGFGSMILEKAARWGVGADRIVPIALPEGPLGRGRRSQLLRRHGLDPAGLSDRLLHLYRKWVRSPR